MDTATLDTPRHELHVLDTTGDTKTTWNPHNADEVAVARDVFVRLKAKGYLAYRVEKGGDKGEVMREFDPLADKMILSPQTVGG
jgi:hypothetical protein